ncbi:MAG: cupin domain-containing protein, partial [Pseudobutyrivibrio sp.]|nr:cupin domain-containing protein [Pseudobutyrivibrio sp.]
CPVDPYVDGEYFKTVELLCEQAEKSEANLVLMGIEPTYPSEKYGYIMPKSKDSIAFVDSFREKPDVETAKEYISRGALWNGGVFAFKLGYLLDIAHKLIEFEDYDDLYSKYASLQKISFDYAVVEKESSIQVVRYNGTWKDLGTWRTLTSVMSENILGNAVMDETCENVHVINETDMPIFVMGLKDAIVSASPDGIIVADKERSSQMKAYLKDFDEDVKYAEKSWGEYRVIDVQPESLTVRVTLKAGATMRYHSHEHRDEIWNVVSGNGTIIVDGMKQTVSRGNVITIQAGCRHTVHADSDLQLIEIQIGKEISAADKRVFELEN